MTIATWPCESLSKVTRRRVRVTGNFLELVTIETNRLYEPFLHPTFHCRLVYPNRHLRMGLHMQWQKFPNLARGENAAFGRGLDVDFFECNLPNSGLDADKSNIDAWLARESSDRAPYRDSARLD